MFIDCGCGCSTWLVDGGCQRSLLFIDSSLGPLLLGVVFVAVHGRWLRALALPFVDGSGHLLPFVDGGGSHCWRHHGKGWWERTEGESEEG